MLHRIAEGAGFDGLWTGVNMRNPRDPAIPVHDGPMLISAWAATTNRIRIGLMIANMVFRRPTVLAKRYQNIGFDEIICYAPKSHEHAVFDKVVAKLDAWH